MIKLNISFISLIISSISLLFSFGVAFREVWISRPKISIKQTEKAERSWVLKSYDGSRFVDKNSDILEPQQESVALIEVIMTNESSLPISILEFHLNGTEPFTSYSYKKDWYAVSTTDHSTVYFGDPQNKLRYLTPELTIDSYTSVRGYLFFWITDISSINQGVNTLEITTSRKTFSKKININNFWESDKSKTYIRATYIENVGALFSKN